MSNQTKLPPPRVFNEELAQCWNALQAGRSIAIYHCLMDLMQSIKPAIMLSQLMYWTRVGTEVEQNDGWIRKTADQLQEETGLSKREQNLCRKKLLQLDLIETNRNRVGASLAYRVKLNNVMNTVAKHHGERITIGLTLQELKNQSNMFFRKYFAHRIAYHRDLVEIAGDINSAIMLSAMVKEAVIYCSNHNQQRAFVSNTIYQWQRKLNLSYKQQKKVRDQLKEKGFIVEKHYTASRRIFTLVQAKNIFKQLSKKRKQNSLSKKAEAVYNKGHIFEKTNIYEDNTASFAEVTNGKVQKLPKGKLRNSQTEKTKGTEGQIINYLDYNKFTIVNYYNYKPTNLTMAKDKIKPSEEKNVVGVIQQKMDYEQLQFPKMLKAPTLKQQAIMIMEKYLPQANAELLQNILDEIAGQTKSVSSPLGLLVVLCRKADLGELLFIHAPIVQKNRKKQQEWQRVVAENNLNIQQDNSNAANIETNKESITKKHLELNGIKKLLSKSKFKSINC